MNSDELERAIQFILECQARTDATLDRVSASQAQREANLTRLEANLDRSEARVARTEANLDREREERIYYDRQFAQMMSTMTELTVIESSRLDEMHKQNEVARAEHKEHLARLDRILDRLNNKN